MVAYMMAAVHPVQVTLRTDLEAFGSSRLMRHGFCTIMVPASLFRGKKGWMPLNV